MVLECLLLFFFFNDPAPTEIYPLSLHDALPISLPAALRKGACTLLWGVALVGGAAHANAPVPEGPLVSTEWLAANLNRADVRIVEVSVNPGLYERSHVPGAVNFSWHNDLNDKVRRDKIGRAHV